MVLMTVIIHYCCTVIADLLTAISSLEKLFLHTALSEWKSEIGDCGVVFRRLKVFENVFDFADFISFTKAAPAQDFQVCFLTKVIS